MASPAGDAGATRHDDELLAYAKVAIGREHGLSDAQAKRLVGRTMRDLHADAVAMAKELGVRDPTVQTRDESGRFANSEGAAVNQAVRRASGRA